MPLGWPLASEKILGALAYTPTRTTRGVGPSAPAACGSNATSSSQGAHETPARQLLRQLNREESLSMGRLWRASRFFVQSWITRRLCDKSTMN